MIAATPGQKFTVGMVRIPPAWRDVQVATDKSSHLQATGVDSKGRRVYAYSTKHRQKASSSKFRRLQAFSAALPRILARIDKDVKRGKEPALVLDLIHKTGFRIGSEGDTKAAKKAYGASTLLGRHVRVKGDTVTFEFVGKKGVDIVKTVKDASIAKMVKDRLPDEPLFTVSDGDVRRYMKSLSPKFVIKDFRTYRGTSTAMAATSKMDMPSSMAEFKRNRKAVAEVVAKELGNTPGVALGSYIAPEVFRPWEEGLKAKGISIVKKKKKVRLNSLPIVMAGLIGIWYFNRR